MTAFLFFFAGATWLLGLLVILGMQAKLHACLEQTRRATTELLASAEAVRDLASLHGKIVDSALAHAAGQRPRHMADIIPLKGKEPPHADA